MAGKFIRELVIHPGYDKRNPDPKKNYGIHGCTVRFLLHNPRRSRSVQFVAYTDWMPKNVQDEHMGKDVDPRTTAYPDVCQVVTGTQPMGADLGYHSNRPMYRGQERMKCDLGKRGWCYYDGSSLAADEVRDTLLAEGSEGVWSMLEKYYIATFGGVK